ncbi:MAG: hypothetical protein WBA10_20870 [Elainellaceae cyanobacterium]
MKSLVVLLLSVLLACWVVAIAVISVQNAFIMTPDGPALASLRFFGRQSPQLPFGVILAAAMATGAVAMGGAIALSGLQRRPR